MDTNSIADAMGEIQDNDLPHTYTPAPPGELHVQYLVEQVEQFRLINAGLVQDNHSLRQTLLSKDQLIATLLQRASEPPTPNPPVVSAVSSQPVTAAQINSSITSKLKTKNPDVWSGTRSTLPRFLASCRSKFMLEAHNFPDEFSKIGFAGSYLCGAPADWWLTLFQRYEETLDKGTPSPEEFTSFTVFAQTLTTPYGDLDLKGTMEHELCALRQTTSVAKYAAEFQRIAGYLTPGWSDDPLMFHYRLHLKENIKNILVHEKPFPTTFLEMVAATILLDNREYEKIRDRNVLARLNMPPLRTRQAPPLVQAIQLRSTLQSTSVHPTAQITSPPATTSDGATPMELNYVSRGRLTDAERERRRDNKLCNYCGEPGHVVRNCPIAPPRPFTPSRGANLTTQAPRGLNFITEIIEPSDMVATNVYAQE
jgi:hypothetical protein